jgi:hypothetical protein
MTGEPVPASAPISLKEFCIGLSASEKRVELIAGFHADEIRAEHFFDVASAYRARFAAFAIRPVK